MKICDTTLSIATKSLMTFNIIVLSIMTLSIAIKNATLIITILSRTIKI